MHCPTFQQILNRLANAKYRSKVDLTDAYFQIRVSPADEDKTAFKTPDVRTYITQELCSKEIATRLQHSPA